MGKAAWRLLRAAMDEELRLGPQEFAVCQTPPQHRAVAHTRCRYFMTGGETRSEDDTKGREGQCLVVTTCPARMSLMRAITKSSFLMFSSSVGPPIQFRRRSFATPRSAGRTWCS